MKYTEVLPGEFISRHNRFIARVKIGENVETVHVKNTGRCKELLIPGCRVYLSCSQNTNRKTKYDLIAVEKKREANTPLLVNIDSQAPNHAVGEWLESCGLFGKDAVIRREVTYGNSRFDFCIKQDNTTYLEVKGVTLEKDGVALFPDAPTLRGVKHINELIECVKNGNRGILVFVIQMKEMKVFRPNDRMHFEFGEALRTASESGVEIIAVDCNITPDTITVDNFVPVDLKSAF
ncbi:MAG: DNA/RNA nuclease SfsA [Clostridia bacterium]|nr:DNA/RNA nuclease SfsA [Clostridia bacterium]